MKKTITLIALICAVSALTACGERDNTSNNENTSSTSSTTSASFEVDSEETSSADTLSTGEDIATDANSEDDDNESENTLESDSEVSSTESSAISSEIDTEYTVSAEEVESSLSGHEAEISGKWKADIIVDSELNEVDGTLLYGSSYLHYGAFLTLNEDGTFTEAIGITTGDESTYGTYTYDGGHQITLLYANDKTTVCELSELNGETAITMPVERNGGSYTIYFTLE